MWKRDYLRHGIENAVRASLSDARLPRFWSGPESFRHRFLPGFPGADRGPRRTEGPPPRIFSPLSCRYRRGIVETVNQRQGRVRGRGIGAGCSSPSTSRARRGT